MSSSFRYTHAIVCDIPASLASEALRMEDTGVVDAAAAAAEHEKYVETLQSLGLRILKAPSEESTPDCVFVEDAVVAANGKAFITRPGAKERRSEAQNMKNFLQKSDVDIQILDICNTSSTVDGGDVLFTGREFFVGLSSRTNTGGVSALSAAFPEFPVHGVTVDAGLHLKSFLSMAAADVVLIGVSEAASSARKQIEAKASFRYSYVEVPDDAAANCLVINGVLLHRGADEFPASIAVIRDNFPDVKKIELTNKELSKVDGALTCCSVLIAA